MRPALQMFHSIPERPWAIAAHFALHGCHHKFPLDASRLVFPPLPAAMVAAAVYGLLRAVLAKVQTWITADAAAESPVQADISAGRAEVLFMRCSRTTSATRLSSFGRMHRTLSLAGCGICDLRWVRWGLPDIRLLALRNARTRCSTQPLAAAGTVAASTHAPPLQVNLHSLAVT
jgi:hypothetical protein